MFENILSIFLSLAGLGGLITMIVNVGKQVNLIKDGDAELWFGGLSVISFIAVAITYFTQQPVDWTQIDAWLEALASLIGLIIQMASGKIAYQVLRGTPIIGYSHDLATQRKAMLEEREAVR